MKAANDYDEGMTPFDAFQAATAEIRGIGVLSSTKDYEEIEVARAPLDPTDEERPSPKRLRFRYLGNNG